MGDRWGILHGPAPGLWITPVCGRPLPRVAARLPGGQGRHSLGGLPRGWSGTNSQ